MLSQTSTFLLCRLLVSIVLSAGAPRDSHRPRMGTGDRNCYCKSNAIAFLYIPWSLWPLKGLWHDVNIDNCNDATSKTWVSLAFLHEFKMRFFEFGKVRHPTHLFRWYDR